MSITEIYLDPQGPALYASTVGCAIGQIVQSADVRARIVRSRTSTWVWTYHRIFYWSVLARVSLCENVLWYEVELIK